MQSPNVPSSSITVAVALDDTTSGVLAAAGQLALRTGMGLHLVHVAQPPLVGLAASPLNLEPLGFGNALRALESQALAAAESRLREAASTLPRGLTVTQKVVVSRAIPEGIMAEAADTGAALILCGAGWRRYTFVPQGFSTALSLMANASIPVIAFKPGALPDFAKDDFRMLVADDLREAGESALTFALQWAARIKGARIRHVHVNGRNREQFRNAIFASISASPVPMTIAMDTDAIYDDVQKHLSGLMAERVNIVKPLIEASHAVWDSRLLEGGVTEELAKAADAFAATITVFGRHTTLHHKPFGIGNVPYRTMLEQHGPIMLVPSP